MDVVTEFVVIGETILHRLHMRNIVPSVGDVVTFTEGSFVVVSREFLIDEHKVVLSLERK